TVAGAVPGAALVTGPHAASRPARQAAAENAPSAAPPRLPLRFRARRMAASPARIEETAILLEPRSGPTRFSTLHESPDLLTQVNYDFCTRPPGQTVPRQADRETSRGRGQQAGQVRMAAGMRR